MSDAPFKGRPVAGAVFFLATIGGTGAGVLTLRNVSLGQDGSADSSFAALPQQVLPPVILKPPPIWQKQAAEMITANPAATDNALATVQAANPQYEFLPNDQFYKRLRYFLEKHEGYRDCVYDCTAGANTIGIGFNFSDKANQKLMQETLGVDADFIAKLGDKNLRLSLSEAQIEALFAASVREAERMCRNKISNFEKLSQGRKIALISLVFNGGPQMLGPKLRTAIRNGWWQDAAFEIEKRSGAVNRGLKNRRADEARIFLINADHYFQDINPPDLPQAKTLGAADIREVQTKFAWLGGGKNVHLDDTRPATPGIGDIDHANALQLHAAGRHSDTAASRHHRFAALATRIPTRV
jgi:GH24 family phage-related lysozyme (muramidase)